MPLWSQLEQDLDRRLNAGEFSDSFPTELTLVDSYGVSRYTVRQALSSMAASGKISASRGHTRRATKPGKAARHGALFSIYQAVQDANEGLTNTVLALEVRKDPQASERLDLAEDADILYLERVRFAGSRPLSHDRAWLPMPDTAALLSVDFTQLSLYDALNRECGIRPDTGRERIQALSPSREARSLLDIPPGVGVFGIERIGFVGSRPIEWRRSIVRGDRFDLYTQWSAHRGLVFEAGPQEVGLPHDARR
jgi:GntR family transcriptional regulator